MCRDVKIVENPISVVLPIYIVKPRIGVSSDQYGYYAISLPKGQGRILNIQSYWNEGYPTYRSCCQVTVKLNIDLQGQVMMLKNVTISAEKMSNIRGVANGCTETGYQNAQTGAGRFW